MTGNILQAIQQLQFDNKETAEGLLLKFIREQFDLDVVAVEIRPLATSLNSFNGFLTLADNSRLFFKTHTESDNVIGEYYRAATLADAGYPVIQPLYSSTEAGKHLLIYNVIEDPAVFDVAWDIENGDDRLFEKLKLAQNRADDDLLALYRATLRYLSASEAGEAPVHQLFHHRLTKGRFERFYGPLPGSDAENDVTVTLPQGVRALSAIRGLTWQINGQVYNETLDDMIARAVRLLDPAQAGPGVIGHGDAHNGNVFLDPRDASLLYFDPAFAGCHDPLLDLTKPLFHNVFAMWMYFPEKKKNTTPIEATIHSNHVEVTYQYDLPPVRHMFLESKIERVLKPILSDLRAKNQLRPDWRVYLKSALFCCPLLTMNLVEKFPPEITLLGLAMSVEMGSESQSVRSLIDQTLDGIKLA